MSDRHASLLVCVCVMCFSDCVSCVMSKNHQYIGFIFPIDSLITLSVFVHVHICVCVNIWTNFCLCIFMCVCIMCVFFLFFCFYNNNNTYKCVLDCRIMWITFQHFRSPSLLAEHCLSDLEPECN